MAARGFMRGHPVEYDGEEWRYSDTGAIADDKRPCLRCGEHPTAEGHDSCLGHIAGAISACCGHGVEDPYVKMAEVSHV